MAFIVLVSFASIYALREVNRTFENESEQIIKKLHTKDTPILRQRIVYRLWVL